MKQFRRKGRDGVLDVPVNLRRLSCSKMRNSLTEVDDEATE